MLLIIHNLPQNTRYADVKALIKDKCGLTEMIVDNLVREGNSLKVTVGLADEADAAILVRKINGLYVSGQQLFVEDVRQKKNLEQPYRTGIVLNQYDQEKFEQGPPFQFNNQCYGKQKELLPQSSLLKSMETKLPSYLPPPKFGVPFYMSTQNQNVNNNQQFMVQYPNVQGSMGNELYERRNIVRKGGEKRGERSMSSERGPYNDRSSRRLSRWEESEYDRSDGCRDGDWSAQRDGRLEGDQTYKNKSYRDSFQSTSNEDYPSNKQNDEMVKKSFNKSEPNWEHPDQSTFRERNESYRFNDNRSFNSRDRRYNQKSEPQRFTENNYSKSRPSDYYKKRSYESSDKNRLSPQRKKFGSNQQFNSKRLRENYDSSILKNYQSKKNSYLNKSPTCTPKQSSKPQLQSIEFQRHKPQWQHSKKQVNFKKDRPASGKSVEPTKEMLARHEAWRVQAASLIATEIFNNVGKMRMKRHPLLTALKACVRTRIDVIAADNMSLTLKDILCCYREKFQDDVTFYSAVLKKHENGEMEEFETIMKECGKKRDNKERDIQPTLQFIGKPPAELLSAGKTERLPKYPDGNKKVLHQLKQAQKDEIISESLYNLDALHEKALKEELDKLEELIKQEIQKSENETEETVSKFMNDEFLPDLLKILTLHVKKRILDVRTNLSVRVLCQYKAPKRNLLDAFLKDYGVVSLKVSRKNRNVMIAICDNYENFDALCKQESALIDNLKVSFKPLHITGPPIKTKFKKNTATVAKITAAKGNSGNESGYCNEEIDDGNDSQVDFAENQINEDSQDVIIVEDNVIKSTDVIVIDENDKVTKDKEVIVLDEISVVEVVTGDDGSAIKNVSTTVDSVEVVVTNDSEVIEQEVPEIIDKNKIAEDVLKES